MRKLQYPYEKDYIGYWNEKGDYGAERVRRMIKRKHERADKLRVKIRERCKYGGRCCEYGSGPYCDWSC